MPLEGESRLFPFIQHTAEWVDEIASVVGIPGLGLVAKLVAKAPLEDVARYLRERAGGRRTIAVSAPMLPPPEAVAPEPQQQGHPAPVANGDAVEFDVGVLQDEYARAEGMSAPILAALDEALAQAGHHLAAFIAETAASRVIQHSQVYGLWPAFALEWKVRRSLSDALAGTAAADEIPALRTLVQGELAAGMIDYIVAKATEGPATPLVLGERIRMFDASAGFRWSVSDRLRTGYVIAAVAGLGAGRPIPGARDAAVDPAEAAEASRTLLTRLGGLSAGGRDELAAAWLRNCAASDFPPKRRQERGVSVNPLLSRIEYPLVHTADAGLREALRPDVEAIYAPPDWRMAMVLGGNLFQALNGLALAYGRNDEDRFSEAADTLRLLLIMPSSAGAKAGVENVIAHLAAARGWVVTRDAERGEAPQATPPRP